MIKSVKYFFETINCLFLKNFLYNVKLLRKNTMEHGENKDRLRLELALDIAQLCMFEVTGDYKLIYLENAHSVFDASDSVIFRRLKQLDGLNLKEYLNRFATSFIHPEDREEFQSIYEQLKNFNICSFEARILQVTGKYVWCKFTVEPVIVDGKITSVIAAIINISTSKERMMQLELSNMMDNFTELYDKTSSFELINKAIENSGPKDRYAFAIMDINDFKKFNDKYGHALGDEILKEVAKTLREQLGQKDCIVGRFGGDEFIILIKDFLNKERLTQRLSAISEYHVHRHICRASWGVSVLNEDANTFSKLFKHADTALYEAKKLEQPIVFYSDIDKKKGI